MNNIKRYLAMLLVLCMLFSTFPMTAFATETDSTNPAVTEPVELTATTEEAETQTVETTEAAEETTEATEETTEATEETTGVADADTEPTDEIVEDELALFGLTRGITVGTKPANGTVTGQPFDTTVSANHRIPGLVYHNGQLVASADARWDYEKDGGGMDLVVSRSSDGNTWNYTYAGYLGDNGNCWNNNSSTMMDPVIISDGSKLYLLSDIFPAGYSISASSTTNVFSATGTGYTSAGNLMLSADDRSTYGYYLKDGAIYDASTNVAVEGYTVTSWFDLYQEGTYVTNLFFSDSPYQLYPTSYISLQTSDDDGATWSAPTLVNAKPDGVTWMVLGPGSGLSLSDGNIAFTTYDGSNIYLIWGSTSNGWNRVSTGAAANESSIIELADGTIRAFVKRGGSNTIAYVDFTKSGSTYTAGNLVDTGEANFSNCMVSSLLYSKTYGGKDVVLVCCPSKSSGGTWAGRFNGKIYAFTLDSSNNMTLLGSYQINNSFFAYSNMVELSDGTVGLLYEDDCISYAAGSYYGNASHISYMNVDLESALGITFDAASQEPETPEINVSVSEEGISVNTVTEVTEIAGLADFVAYDVTLTKDGSNYTGSASITLPLAGKFGEDVELWGFVVESDGTITYVKENVVRDLENDTVTFSAPHFSTVGATAKTGDTVTQTVTLNAGESTTITDNTGNYENAVDRTDLDESIATVVVEGTTIENSFSLEELTSLAVNDTFYIQVSDGVYLTADAGTTSNLDDAGLWTAVTVTTSYLSVRNNSNMYLGVNWGGNPYTSQSVLYLKWADGKLAGYYSSYEAGTPVKITGAQAVNQTDITIIGISKGSTSITVGNTVYEITVNIPAVTLHAYSGMSKTATVTGTVTAEAIEAFNAQYGSTVTVALEGDTLTFTGVAAGTVTAILGNTEYTVTISDGATAGNIADFNNIIGTQSYQGDSNASGADGVVELTGKKITALTVGAGSSFQLGVDVTGADSVEWTVADATKITVSETGMVTGIAAGDTTVTATVIKNGVIESITIPVHVTGSFGTSTDMVTVCYYVEQVTNVYPYYTLYSSAGVNEELISIQEGQVIFFERPKASAFGMIFLSTPEDGYALTYMAATNTDAQYYPLHTGDYNLKTGDNNYYASGNSGYPYYNIYTYYGGNKDTMDAMLKKALDDLKCDGAMSMGRKSGDNYPNLGCSLSFIADPVPQITKTVDGILPTTRKQVDYRKYTEGMVASVGELVYFKITVSLDRPTVWADEANGIGAITYTDAIVSDTVLKDAYFYDKTLDKDLNGTIEDSEGNKLQTQDITAKLNAEWGASEETRTIDLYLVYQIKTEDIPKFIIDNVANLSTNYKSKYSTGVSNRAADATASITVVGRSMDNIVIDFGQKVVYTGLTDDHLKGVYTGDALKYKADYGTIEITKTTTDGANSYTVTYTPTSILQKPDVVWLYGLGVNDKNEEVEKIINGFIVYPATSVYYEEGFIFDNATGSWDLSNAKKATLEQTFELLGKSVYNGNGTMTERVTDKTFNYGYDDCFNSSDYADSYATSYTIGDKTSFEFTGNGIQIFANSKEGSGYVSVEVKNSAGKVVNLSMVDTATTAGSTSATTGQIGELNDLPIVSLVDLQNVPHDTYTVTITKIMESEPVYITGIRVFNTVADSTIFAIDLEDNPEYFELRDYVLNALSIGTDAKLTADELAAVVDQVYAAISSDSEAPASAMITSGSNSAITDTATAQDLLDNGPKNELYLYSGQTLTFKVTSSRIMQIGLKAPQGGTTASISINGGTATVQDVKSSVDMFYNLVSTAAGTDTEYTVSITNTGYTILSVTLLKVCDDPCFAFAALTAEDIENVLTNVYDLVEDEETETPVEPSKPEEEVPEESTEPETEPSRPTRPSKPGHGKPGSGKPTRPTEEDTNKEAEAVLNIVFINLRGKQVGTATLTKTGNENSRCVFSATEISAHAPANYRALWFFPSIVSYGDAATIIVTVI